MVVDHVGIDDNPAHEAESGQKIIKFERLSNGVAAIDRLPAIEAVDRVITRRAIEFVAHKSHVNRQTEP